MGTFNNTFNRSFNQIVSLLNQNYEPETTAYVSELAIPLGIEQIVKINNLVKALKTGLGITSLSDTFDVFYILSNQTAEAGLRNIVKDAHHCTSLNMPNFEAYKGFKGNKINQYIDTNYNQNSDGFNYELNSASIGTYLSEMDSNTSVNYYIHSAGDGVNVSQLVPSHNSFPHCQINSGRVNTPTSYSIPQRALFIQNKVDSSKTTWYVNGASHYEYNYPSTALPIINTNLLCLYNGSNRTQFSDARVSCHFQAKGFTPSEIKIVNAAIENYMVSINNGYQIKVTQPTVIFCFDDGNAEHATLTKSIFDNRGVKATLYIISDRIDQAGYLTSADLLSLHEDGYDIQCHSQTHTNPRDLTSAQINAEFAAVDALFTNIGIPTPKHHAYPGGVSYSRNINEVYKYRQTARGIGNTFKFHNGYITGMFNIGTARTMDNGGLSSLTDGIDVALANNGLVIFYGHGVYEDDPSETIYHDPVKASVLRAGIDYALDSGVSIKTISDIFTNPNY